MVYHTKNQENTSNRTSGVDTHSCVVKPGSKTVMISYPVKYTVTHENVTVILKLCVHKLKKQTQVLYDIIAHYIEQQLQVTVELKTSYNSPSINHLWNYSWIVFLYISLEFFRSHKVYTELSLLKTLERELKKTNVYTCNMSRSTEPRNINKKNQELN